MILSAQPAPGSAPDFQEHDQATAKSLSQLSQGCNDSICRQSKALSGGIYLAQNDPNSAQKVYQGLGQNAADKNDIRSETLAKALIALSEGRILDAKFHLIPVQDHPYAQTLLKLIKANDEWVTSVETAHILMALCDDELANRKKSPEVEKIKDFLKVVEQRLMERQGPRLADVMASVAKDESLGYAGLAEAVDRLGDGAGQEIVRSASLDNESGRAQILLTLLNDKLLPSHRAGSSYLIARIFEKHPTFGNSAQKHLLELSGIKTDPRRVFMEMVDEGLGSFSVALLALMPARGVARWTWGRYAARFGEPLAPFGRRWLIGQGISLAASTGTYFLSEKLVLTAVGHDGKIWPGSVGEAARELGADMIVMGLANLLGGGARALNKKWFPPPPPSRWFFTAGRYAYRTPLKTLFYLGYGLAQGGGVYFNHRWQDNTGFIDRFRPGKPAGLIRLLDPSWNVLLLEGHQLQSADRTLGHLLNHLMLLRDTPSDNQLRRKVSGLKQWIGRLDPSLSVEQEETLLGIFWVAQEERGVLGGSSKDYLLKWMQKGEYEKMNDYFNRQKIPLSVDSLGNLKASE